MYADSLPDSCRRADIDAGKRQGATTDEALRIRQLEAKVGELKRSFKRDFVGDVLASSRGSSSRDFRGDSVRVAPICGKLLQHGVQIAPSTYYAAKVRRRRRASSAMSDYCSKSTESTTGSGARDLPAPVRCYTSCAATSLRWSRSARSTGER